MSQEPTDAESAAPQAPAIDPDQVEELKRRLRSDQNLLFGIIGGLVGALVSAVLWAVITVVTGYQIGFMAIGVGFVVGLAVGKAGKGIDTVFGIVGAALALLGCVVGNSLATVGIVAKVQDYPYFELLGAMNLNDHMDLIAASFSPMDLLFYAIAVYEGYRFAFRRITQEEVASMLQGSQGAAP